MSGCHVPAMSGIENVGSEKRVQFCIACNQAIHQCQCIWSAIRELQAKQKEDWERIYKRDESFGNRLIDLESSYQDKATDIVKLICNVEDAFNRIENLETSLKHAQRNLRDACARIEKLEDYILHQKSLPSIDCGEMNKVIDRINKFDETHNKKPYICPVCNGWGRQQLSIQGQTDIHAYDCHPCEGKGVLWG